MTTTSSTPSSPPVTMHDEQLERAILGAVLLAPEAYYEISDLVTERSFQQAPHRLVWRAMGELMALGNPVDEVTLRAHLERSGQLQQAGGTALLVDIADSIFSAANVRAHALILVAHQKRRALRQALGNALSELNDEPDALLDRLQAQLLEIGDVGCGPLRTTSEQIVQMMAADLEVLEGRMSGWSWPLQELTVATRGIRSGRIYLVIGLFKSGKSKFTVATIHQLITRENTPVLFLSMEMPSRQVFHWLAGCDLSINSEFYDSPRLSRDQMNQTHDWVQSNCGEGQLQINDRAVQTPASICAAMRRAAIRHGVKVVFIDYLQKIAWADGTPSVLDISRGMNLIAATAKRLNLAVIGLSQVPKSVEKQAREQMINLGDVKDASAFAETADCAIAITDPERHKEGPERGVRNLKLLIEQRDGPTRVLDVRADLRFGHFFALTRESAPAL